MADKKRTRRFEGTCYIPGEQLAIMAKYYRGANLNLNLSLVEDDLTVVNESLENSCWCSKLNEVDRMKLQHMKGDAWKIQHDHHNMDLNMGGEVAERGSGNCCFSPVKLSKDMQGGPKTGVDKETETMSPYNRSVRIDYDNSRYDVRKPSVCDNNYQGYDGNLPRREIPKKGYLPQQHGDFYRQNYNTNAYPVARIQSENRYQRNGGYEMEDGISSRWASEKSDDEIKCVVCKKEVCAVCKNPLHGRPCHCKCPIPNAGLCNECDMQCEKESDKQVGTSQEQPQTNLSNLMLLMMSSQMFNRPQNTGPPCMCDVKNTKSTSVCDCDSASGSTSCSCGTEKVQKIFLYDCEPLKKTRNGRSKKSKKRPSTGEDSSSSCGKCDCCKCSKKDKKPIKSPETRKKPSNMQGEIESESSSSQLSSKEASDKPIKNTKTSKSSNKPSANSTKPNKPSASSSINRTTDKGKKAEAPRSSFRQPLVDNVNRSKASNKGKRNAKKRTATEDSKDGGSDRESPSSHSSSRDGDSMKSSQSPSIEFEDYLVCLPKIKSHLEQLLVKISDDGQNVNSSQTVSHFSGPVTQPYYTNVKVRSNAPFITNPVAYASVSSGSLNHSTAPSSKFHPNLQPNFGYSVLQNNNMPSTRWGEFNIFNHGVSQHRHRNSVYPMEQQYHCLFPSQPTDKPVHAPHIKPQNHIRGGYRFHDHLTSNHQRPNIRRNVSGNTFGTSYVHPSFKRDSIHQGFQISNNLLNCRQTNGTTTETLNLTNLNSVRQRNVFRSFNNQNTAGHIDHKCFNHLSTFPIERNSSAAEDSKITSLVNKMNSNNDGDPQDDRTEMKVEGIYQLHQSDTNVLSDEGSSKNSNSCTTVAINKGFDTFKAQPLNEPMQSIQSSDSKHTTDQFISAVEVNEQQSEDTFRQEVEHKEMSGKLDQEANEDYTTMKTNQSIGPGQFKVTSFKTSCFNLPNGPTEKNQSSTNPDYQHKRRKRLHEDVETDGCLREEGNNDAHRLKVESLGLTNPAVESREPLKSRAHDVITSTSEEMAPTRYTSFGDLMPSEPLESVISLSATPVKTSDIHDAVLSEIKLRPLNPALKVDAQYYNMIDQIASTSEVVDDSKESVKRGWAHSSPPSSEEDVSLPLLPEERTPGNQVETANQTKQYGVQHSTIHDGKCIFGGFQQRTNLQAAKLRFAQEAIQSMVENVNEVLASIDSDSESKICAATSNYEDRERQSFFVHLGSDESMNKRPQCNVVSRNPKAATRGVRNDQFTSKPPSSKVGQSFNGSNQHNSRVTEYRVEPHQSRQSFSSNELDVRGSSSGTPTSSGNAAFKTVSRERKYFVIDSGSSKSSVFTEKLLQSLAKETSSPNLSELLTPEEYKNSGHLKRTGPSKPLKRRSWIPPLPPPT